MESVYPVSFWVAFMAGVLTFASPCIFPLIPAYISYITGISLSEMAEAEGRNIRYKALAHALLFVLGFSFVFICLGASASLIGGVIIAHKLLLSRLGGLIVIFFGLHIIGLFRLGALDKEKRITLKARKGSKLGSFFLGITFAAAWTPCVGPILGSILIYAGTKETMFEGVKLLAFYSLGIGIPFIISALLINLLVSIMPRLNKYLAAVKYVCGVLLILMGILLITGNFAIITRL